MEILAWIRFIAGAIFMIIGLLLFVIQVFGVFRFKYVLNRMHSAAMGDTLGIASSLIGLILMCGFSFTSLKLFLVVMFLWLASPTSSHLIAQLEVATNEDYSQYEHVNLDEIGEGE
ncbi:MAG: monovalent cation/H(+) antiporter subunit G [Longicatena sp.]|nr:monovalent cation/H(+) antiporter subunit G [Longicatena sp.]